MENNNNQQLPYTVDEYYAFIADGEASYFYSNFKSINNGNKNTWNWAAFLLGPVWLVYRKLYSKGILIFLLEIILNAIIFGYLGFIVRIVLALRGNYLYYKYTNEKIAEVKSMDIYEPNRHLKLSEVGGTNKRAAGVLLLIFSIILLTIMSEKSAFIQLLISCRSRWTN